VDKTVEVSFANLEEGTEQWFVCFIFFLNLKDISSFLGLYILSELLLVIK